MRLALFATIAAAWVVQGSALAPDEDAFPLIAQYDPPLVQAQFLSAAAAGEITVRSLPDMFLGRRQTCGAYDYCSYGYCLYPDSTCCPSGPCDPGTTCCGYSHCHPINTECCSDEGYCDPGNICVKFRDLSYDVCCTDTSCTAYVAGGATVLRTTTAPVETATQAVYTYYYFYITWTYYVYYWYYSVAIEASVVTSSVETTTTTVSVRAPDSAAASRSFAEISATFSQYTPLSATTLKPLAGSTFTGDTGPSLGSNSLGSSMPTTTFAGGGGGGGGGMTPTTSLPAFTIPGGTNAGVKLEPWAGYLTVCFFSSVAVVGILMVVL